MGKVGNVPTDIQEGIRDALGRKTKLAFARAVNLEVKPDKYDARILAMNDHRVFILTPKTPMKLETNLHFLDINLLESKSPTKLVIGTESKRIVLSSPSQDENTDEFDRAVGHIIVSLAKVFPSVLTEKLIAKVDFTPPTRLQDFRKIGANIGKKDEGPCGNFSSMYRCMCDYYNVEVQEDVAWDVDMIYQSQDSKEMNLKDFDHLDNRHLPPIISALEHNLWFTRLNASNVKLSPETINEILKIMKTNVAIEELVLANISVRADFCQRLCMSLVANTGSPLTVLDLSGNIIEDRGLNHLCAPVTKLSRGLVELNLSMTGITARGVNKLAEALLGNKNIPLNLRCLDLSENGFKGEDVSSLFNFLAQPNALTDLRLGSSECALESLFAALQRGCAQNLTNLDVSNNTFSYKKQGKDSSVPPSWKQFFATAISLKSINFSASRLPPDALRSVLEGIGSNPSLNDVELNLSSNGLGLPGNQGSQILDACLSNVRNISHLDLSDNGFDVALASILGKLSQNKSLQKLSIGRNLNSIKPKNVPQVIEAIIQLIHQEYSPIRCLNVDNLRLKTDTALLINALGTNDTLTEIDISGNQMGDTGARMLSKALQLNKTLNVIYWDHNSTSPNGFQDIAASLERNFYVKWMPMPVNDAAQSLRVSQEKTEQALQKIESILQRNHSPRKLRTDKAYRLQQSFMTGTLQPDIDVHLVQLQDHIEKFENLRQKYQLSSTNASAQEEVAKAQGLLKEAESAKLLLLQLQRIVHESEKSGLLQKELNALGSNLCEVAEKQLKANVSAMIGCAEKQFPITLKNESLQEELMTSSEAKGRLSEEFVQSLIVDHLAADVENKTNELNLLAASHISDRISDEVTSELEKSVQSLKTVLSSMRAQLLVNGQLKDEDAESKEHRENLRRNKSSVTTDEEQDATTEMPSISNKHKSQMQRRLRPQSAVDATDVKKALELCRVKPDLSATADLEPRIDASNERSSSEERHLDDDDGRTGSLIPTPSPRKRRGQPNGKAQGVDPGAVSKSGKNSTKDKKVTESGKGESPQMSNLNPAHNTKVSQGVAKGSPKHSENAELNIGTGSPHPVATSPQRKAGLSAPGSKEVPTAVARGTQRKSDLMSSNVGGTASQAIVNAGEVVQKTASQAPHLVSGSEEVGKIYETLGEEEMPEKSVRSSAQPPKTAGEAGVQMVNLEEKVKVSGPPVTDKVDTLDHVNGKAFEEAAVYNSGVEFFPTENVPVKKLEHLGKERPKRPKNKPMTRPMPSDPVIDEYDVSRGLSDFFDAKPSTPHQMEKKENGEIAGSEDSEEMSKSDASNKKEKAKAAALSPKVESKGFASNFKNLFKKKSPEGDTPPLTRKSTDESPVPESNQVLQMTTEEKPLECGDSPKPSEETNKKEVEEPVESRPKQPAGLPKFGLPGMAGGGVNLAELRSKKASAKHVTNPGESGKTATVETAKEKSVRSVEKKPFQPREISELLPSTEDSISGVSSRLSVSTKVRPPPPLAPKPNKRASVIGTPAAAATTTSSPATTAAASKQEAEETQDPDQKTDVLQTIDTTPIERKNRMSVREKAANIDKNSNLKSSADGSQANRKSITLTTDSSPRSSECLAQQPSSDSVSLASPSLTNLDPSGADTPPAVPSDPPSDNDNEGDDDDECSKAAAKRQSGVDVIHI